MLQSSSTFHHAIYLSNLNRYGVLQNTFLNPYSNSLVRLVLLSAAIHQAVFIAQSLSLNQSIWCIAEQFLQILQRPAGEVLLLAAIHQAVFSTLSPNLNQSIWCIAEQIFQPLQRLAGALGSAECRHPSGGLYCTIYDPLCCGAGARRRPHLLLFNCL